MMAKAKSETRSKTNASFRKGPAKSGNSTKTSRRKSTAKSKTAELKPTVAPTVETPLTETTDIQSYPVNRSIDQGLSVFDQISSKISGLQKNQASKGISRISGPVDGGCNLSRKVLAQIALIASAEVDGISPP